MPSQPAVSVRSYYEREWGRIRHGFERTGDGTTAVARRSALIDEIALRLWDEFVVSEHGPPERFCLVARGGYGRGLLFPHSDIDLLFLTDSEALQHRYKTAIWRICQEMWDIRLRVSPTARTLAGCGQLDPNNIEMALSLLDCRYLAGDRHIFEQLQGEVLPQLAHREWQGLAQGLMKLTQTRHSKYGNTVFHLEPNIKECPGGLRDYDVACWLGLLGWFEKHPEWPSEDGDLRASIRKDCSAGVAFLASVRCFLHYVHGRDDNTLTWDAQLAAAQSVVGLPGGAEQGAAEWMRNYFRHARPINRWTLQLLDEVPAARSSLYKQFRRWRSRVSNADFSVVDERVYLQQSSAAEDLATVLRLFEFIARHGLKIARDTERRIEQALRVRTHEMPAAGELWSVLRGILVAPHAAQALRDMHAVGVLDLIVPEYRNIDALVVRDLYHRYTVDEHSFRAVDSLHELKQHETTREARFGSVLENLEEPELLYLALLLHDLGKGTQDDKHVQGSLRLGEAVLERLGLSEAQRETVRFLIGNHLEMSATLRRDIFDPETIAAFTQKVGSPERLKMLCLLTYGDIRAVNPEALTAWKAESLWHLYVGALNHLDRNVDEERFRAEFEQEYVGKVSALLPRRGAQLRKFLAGLPQRYLRTHSTEQVAVHFQMASKLQQEPIQVALKLTRDLYELTLITRDRPFLFAAISGALTAWGMDIVKANAFSNAAGVVVDSLLFRDRFRTLELNPPERERFKRNLLQALAGEMDLRPQIQTRITTARLAPVKMKVSPRLSYDDNCSSHSTLLEVIAQDRMGLLHAVASTLGEHGCNIEIALIDTEGPMAVDVFYLTEGGKKLNAATEKALQAALTKQLEEAASEPARVGAQARPAASGRT